MKRMNNDVSCARAPSLSLTDPTLSFQTFNELDNLEIATASENEEENSPPPLPPRTSSCVVQDRPLPISPPDSSRQLEQISEPSDPTSSDVSDIIDDTDDSSDSDSDDDEDVKTLKNGRDFDANSCLPPVPNGTLDLTIPSDKQRFSSDDERWVVWLKVCCLHENNHLHCVPNSQNAKGERQQRQRAAPSQSGRATGGDAGQDPRNQAKAKRNREQKDFVAEKTQVTNIINCIRCFNFISCRLFLCENLNRDKRKLPPGWIHTQTWNEKKASNISIWLKKHLQGCRCRYERGIVCGLRRAVATICVVT